MKAASREQRRGMALLTVLLLTATMATVCVAILDDVRFSVRRTTNAEVMAQAQAYAAGAEALAAAEIGRLTRASPTRTPIQPAWNGREMAFPVEDGSIRARLSDGQACFNVNSLVLGQGEDLIVQPEGVAQFIALGVAVGVPHGRMAGVADAIVDWMDADGEVRPGGAEDARYAARTQPYRTAGVRLAEVSEIRAVQGMDAALYRRLRPWLCALPTTRLSPLNPNTLRPDQAPLLVAVSLGRLPSGAAKAALAARPAGGWSDIDAFWRQPALAAARPSEEARAQLALVTRFFDLDVDVELAGLKAVRTARLELAADGTVRTVSRRWTIAE
jgi:general secretion pathway protein K